MGLRLKTLTFSTASRLPGHTSSWASLPGSQTRKLRLREAMQLHPAGQRQDLSKARAQTQAHSICTQPRRLQNMPAPSGPQLLPGRPRMLPSSYRSGYCPRERAVNCQVLQWLWLPLPTTIYVRTCGFLGAEAAGFKVITVHDSSHSHDL